MDSKIGSTTLRAVAVAPVLLLVACGGNDATRAKTTPQPQPSTYAQRVLGALDNAAVERTRQDMIAVLTAIQSYTTDNGSPPAAQNYTELTSLITPSYIRRLPPTDAWGSPFVYQRGLEGIISLIAPGEDGKVGSDDDLMLTSSGVIKLPSNFRPVQ